MAADELQPCCAAFRIGDAKLQSHARAETQFLAVAEIRPIDNWLIGHPRGGKCAYDIAFATACEDGVSTRKVREQGDVGCRPVRHRSADGHFIRKTQQKRSDSIDPQQEPIERPLLRL